MVTGGVTAQDKVTTPEQAFEIYMRYKNIPQELFQKEDEIYFDNQRDEWIINIAGDKNEYGVKFNDDEGYWVVIARWETPEELKGFHFPNFSSEYICADGKLYTPMQPCNARVKEGEAVFLAYKRLIEELGYDTARLYDLFWVSLDKSKGEWHVYFRGQTSFDSNEERKGAYIVTHDRGVRSWQDDSVSP